VHAAMRGTVTWHMQLQGHGEAGHVSIVMSFCPCHPSSLLQSVVGSSGPQERGWLCHAVTGLLQKRKLAKKMKEKIIKHTRKTPPAPVPIPICSRLLSGKAMAQSM
jgi:hypothetical protein